MKKPVILLLLIGFFAAASAQKVHFLYFQSENGFPFYLKLSNKLYSSGNSGFVVISNLPDSTYVFTIGFPSSSNQELKYTIAINGSDRGVLLKNGENGLSLLDLQSQTVITSDVEITKETQVFETRTDRFSTILSKAADDPNLLKVAVKQEVKKPEEKKDTLVQTEVVNNEPKADSNFRTIDSSALIVNQSQMEKEIPLTTEEPKKGKNKKNKEKKTVETNTGTEVLVEEKKPEVISVENPPALEEKKVPQTPEPTNQEKITPITSPVTTEEYKRSLVSRTSESSTTEGFGLVYYDIVNGAVDTIRLLIPNPKTWALVNENAVVKQDEIKAPDAIIEKPLSKKKKESKKETKKEEPQIVEAKMDEVQNTPPPIVEQPSTVQISTSSCMVTASEKDFFKLRKNMAGKITDESMIEEAKKYFKKECFTTEQLRNLGSLFLTSAGKYLFFDAAYFHVSDKENFASLSTEIKDEYYLKRFKALVGE